jgi:hypothetical protein
MIVYRLFAAAAAVSTPPAASPQPAQQPPKKEKMICKSESFVGSRVPKRICMTESEWQAGRQGAKDTMDAIGRGADFRNPSTKGPN